MFVVEAHPDHSERSPSVVAHSEFRLPLDARAARSGGLLISLASWRFMRCRRPLQDAGERPAALRVREPIEPFGRQQRARASARS